MRAALGDVESALVELARSVAIDTGVTSIEQLPPAADGDAAWTALERSGLLTLRSDGGSVLGLVLCAEQFAQTLSATPFVGASLARELIGSSSERVVMSLDGDLAPDALGARRIAFARAGHVHIAGCGEVVATADRSRVAVAISAGDITSITGVDAPMFSAIAQVLLAADLVGTGIAAVHEAVDHAGHRRQFGVRIGTFQAVQHLLADAWVDLVAARNSVRAAAWRLDHRDANALASAARAALVASEAGVTACEAATQALGGMGHTWEHLMSVRLRRALVDRAMLPVSSPELLCAPIATTPEGRVDAEGFDLRDDETEASMRHRLRSWLATRPATDDWHRQLAAAGFVGVSMPIEAGGAGLPVTCEAIVSEELGAADMPPPPAIAHLAHALARFGTTEQRTTHLSGLLDGSLRWCQGFSEPDAGSDLAGIRTRAVRDGGDFVIDGRKVWTSDAVGADRILLLCRTEEDPHQGLSILLVPMDVAGIEVSTIVTAWGSDEFAEVAFDRVRVPQSALLGDEGQGWEIAMSLLAIERGPADIGWIARFRRTALALLADPDLSSRSDVRRAAAWIEALEATVATTLTDRRGGTFDPVTGSVDKLLMTKVDQLLHAARLEATDDLVGEPTTVILEQYLWSRAASVFGGTSQIQRSIVAQRVLGLPRA